MHTFFCTKWPWTHVCDVQSQLTFISSLFSFLKNLVHAIATTCSYASYLSYNLVPIPCVYRSCFMNRILKLYIKQVKIKNTFNITLFCPQCLPLTWAELEPLHIIFMLLNVIMWASLYHASTTDPGYLPRNVPEYDRAIKEVRPHWIKPETLYHRDDALLYIAYVMLIWAAPIPADRWHCSLWP